MVMLYQLTVSGRVQGVGYRNYVTQIAKKLDLKGNVRNKSNGQVLIIVQIAEDQDLKDFVQAIQIPGHPYMRIDQVEYAPLDYRKDFRDFRPIY